MITQEYPFIRCKSIDVFPPGPGNTGVSGLVGQLLSELTGDNPEPDVAYLHQHGWLQTFKPIRFQLVDTIIQINGSARKKLHQDISVMWWFENPTIKTLSQYLLEQTRENAAGETKGTATLGHLKKRVNK